VSRAKEDVSIVLANRCVCASIPPVRNFFPTTISWVSNQSKATNAVKGSDW
jgi:hypothetical protein